MSDLQSQWLGAIQAMTATPEDAASYLDRRLRFTTEIASSLIHNDPVCDTLVYGVWLERHQAPIYIGQTTEGRRRLWDLPIGESHHLANSFPPEIWGRVVVVYWGQMLAVSGSMAKSIAKAIEPLVGGDPASLKQAVGLGIEFLLQKNKRPLFNGRKKRRNGTWRSIVWDDCASLGARASIHLEALYYEIDKAWKELADVSPKEEEELLVLPFGKVVFPARIRLNREREQSSVNAGPTSGR